MTKNKSKKVFDKLRKKEPSFRERLVAISGNLLENNLDLSSNENFEEFKNSINVVFHLAGTVDLDLDLKYFFIIITNKILIININFF